jgi:hypothetical protein
MEQVSPRFLNAKLPTAIRPNSGTLTDTAPMYSSFTRDGIYRGHLPRGDLELTMGLTFGGNMAETPRGVFGGGPLVLSRTLIR